MNEKAKHYIQKLQLKKHPEGGYFKEIYRGGEMILVDPPDRRLKRNYSTSIYFLLEGKQVSKFHRLKSDEIWHFYDGSPIKIYIIDEKGKLSENILGKSMNDEAVFQIVIRKNNWFAAELINKKTFSLVGCTVSPGFDFSDFEFGDREQLSNQFPKLKELIERLT
jgi:predicted cupin superfamily sugar epimerase